MARTISVLGSVGVSELWWNVSALRRPTRPLTDDIEPNIFVGLQNSGGVRLTQGERQAETRPGDFIVFDNTKPYTFSLHGTINSTFMRIPTRLLGLRPSLLAEVTAVRLGRERPIVDVAAAFFCRLARNQAAIGETEAGLLSQSSIELVRALVTAGLGHDDLAKEPLDNTLVERVMTYIRLHLAEHDLRAERIAAEHYISVRQLYLTLARADISLGDWIRSQRLEECKRELSLPAHQFMTIEAIARRWGFISAPHFSRAFRAAFGMSAREWRQMNRQPRTS
jgi:AraC-like DNA-binding protein